MAGKVFLTMAVAGVAACLPFIPTASAYDSVLAFSPNPIDQCSALAGKAETAASAANQSVSICDRAVERARQSGDDLAESYVNRSVIHLARLEYDATIADSDAALRIHAGISQALVNRGIALSAKGRNAEAADSFTRALALNPAHPETIYFNRALTREDAGDAKGAYLDYRKAAQLAPTWDSPKQQLARFTVAHAPTS